MPKELISRQRYLDNVLLFRDTDLIKVVTGVRRCGKSSLLELIRERIESEQIPGTTCLSLNLESRLSDVRTPEDLYGFFRSKLSDSGKAYLFIDEPQRIRGWEDAVNAMRIDFDCDIYLTGSNAYLLSSELSTYLSGRYVETKMLPLSFAEYCSFCGVTFSAGSSIALAGDETPISFDDLFVRYLQYGGMPAIASLATSQAMHSTYISGVYDAIVVRDILNRERALKQSKVTDADLLRRIVEFLSDNIGNTSTPSSIANTLTSAGSRTSNKTVASYIKALEEAYLFYSASRYDLHGKALLSTQPKKYLVDLGFRSYLSGYRTADMGRVFENAVYLQLLYEGWRVHVGKLYNKEVDFVAIRDGRVVYIQAADEMYAESTREREAAPLRSIRDDHEKLIVVRQGHYEDDIDGIRIVGAQDFFLRSQQ